MSDVLVVCDQQAVETLVTCTGSDGLVHYVHDPNTWCSWIRTWQDGTKVSFDDPDKLVTCFECIAQEYRNAEASSRR